jgi:hypothetical protein
MTTNLKRKVGAVLAALSIVLLGAGVGIATGSSAGAANPSLRPFATAALSGRTAVAIPLVAGHPQAASTVKATGANSNGYLTIFQEASAAPLSISVNNATPFALSADKFGYGLIPAGTYSVTATDGASINVTGNVVVGAGQHVTAILYLTPGGTAALTSFVNTKVAPPSGQSRLVIGNYANSGAVDVYVDGNLVAPDLTNTPASPTSISVIVPGGPTTVAVTVAGQPLASAFDAQSGLLGVGDNLNVFVVGDATASPSTAGLLTNLVPLASGYRLYATDGGVFDFGSASFHGSTGGTHLNQPIVGAAPTAIGLGYWLGAADGGIFSFGDASFFGSAGSLKLAAPIVGMVATPDEGGYWLVASDGGVFAFGDAAFYGSMGSRPLNAPVVAVVGSPDGGGYWLLAADGGVFSFGDAEFQGGLGGTDLGGSPIVGAAEA